MSPHEQHIDRMTWLRDHHMAKAETDLPTADFHAAEAVRIDEYLAAAERDRARIAKRGEGA